MQLGWIVFPWVLLYICCKFGQICPICHIIYDIRKNFSGRSWLSPPKKYFSKGAKIKMRAPLRAPQRVLLKIKTAKIHFTVKFLF